MRRLLVRRNLDPGDADTEPADPLADGEGSGVGGSTTLGSFRGFWIPRWMGPRDANWRQYTCYRNGPGCLKTGVTNGAGRGPPCRGERAESMRSRGRPDPRRLLADRL